MKFEYSDEYISNNEDTKYVSVSCVDEKDMTLDIPNVSVVGLNSKKVQFCLMTRHLNVLAQLNVYFTTIYESVIQHFSSCQYNWFRKKNVDKVKLYESYKSPILNNSTGKEIQFILFYDKSNSDMYQCLENGKKNKELYNIVVSFSGYQFNNTGITPIFTLKNIVPSKNDKKYNTSNSKFNKFVSDEYNFINAPTELFDQSENIQLKNDKSQKSVKEDSVKSRNEKLDKKENSIHSIRSNKSKKSVRPEKSNQSIQSEKSNKSLQSEKSIQSIQSIQSLQSIQSIQSIQSLQSEKSIQSLQSEKSIQNNEQVVVPIVETNNEQQQQQQQQQHKVDELTDRILTKMTEHLKSEVSKIINEEISNMSKRSQQSMSDNSNVQSNKQESLKNSNVDNDDSDTEKTESSSLFETSSESDDTESSDLDDTTDINLTEDMSELSFLTQNYIKKNEVNKKELNDYESESQQLETINNLRE